MTIADTSIPLDSGSNESSGSTTLNNWRCLIVDSFDSFTLNIAALLQNAGVRDLHIISSVSLTTLDNNSLNALVKAMDLIIIGPGPGSPTNLQDLAGIPNLWAELETLHSPPAVLGICLGFQFMLNVLAASSSRIQYLEKPRHGIVSKLKLTPYAKDDIFQDIPGSISVVRYHSIYVELVGDSTDICDIVPLAYAEDDGVLMAARHHSRPFWALQYHPESIYSAAGLSTIMNLFRLANHELTIRRDVLGSDILTENPRLGKFLLDQNNSYVPRPRPPLQPDEDAPERVLLQQVVKLPSSVVDIGAFIISLCDVLLDRFGVFCLLDSAAAPGSWTYIGISTEFKPRRFRYYLPDPFLTESDGTKEHTWRIDSLDDVWAVLSHAVAPPITRVCLIGDIRNGNSDINLTMDEFTADVAARHKVDRSSYPSFFGGHIGYISYEAGVSDGLGLSLDKVSPAEVPDINLTFHERSLAVDLARGIVYVHSFAGDRLYRNDRVWVSEVAALISSLVNSSTSLSTPVASLSKPAPKFASSIHYPERSAYIDQITKAQHSLSVGDSYELCLTATTIAVEKEQLISDSDPNASRKEMLSDWALYKYLRKLNPAPYACFIRTGPTTLIGASPERFLCWDDQARTCELRPIKGTVSRASMNDDKEAAEAALRTPKEIAENLMIVDLIRHDLSRFCSHVGVPQLMGVETYATVFHLVSAIVGSGLHRGLSGVDVLRGSLPPGSMTGAPKRRSVEILQDLEKGRRRAVYSGVAGYWDVLGHGDWSVIIRSAYSVGGAGTGLPREWRLGAGGAITVLSDPVGEWEEMEVKLRSVMRAFSV
ncbi:ADC synthase [Dipodascopsis uninucleata]